MGKPDTTLKRLLKERGMTQMDLVKKSGLSEAVVSRAVRGAFSLESRRRIAEALGISEEVL